MTLEELIQQYRDGEVKTLDALTLVVPFLKAESTKVAAKAFVDEVIGLPEEPKSMTATERALGKAWERGYRSK